MFPPISVPSYSRDVFLSFVPGFPTYLAMNWSVPIPRNGIITTYSVYCNTSDSQAYPEQVIGQNVPTIRSIVNGTTLATTLTGFYPYTKYSCYVTANTSVGEGNSSNVLSSLTSQSGNCQDSCNYTNGIHIIVFLWSPVEWCLPVLRLGVSWILYAHMYMCM